MKRDILFRGKSIATGQWLFGFYRAVFEHHEIIGFGGERYDVDPETVGQFIGILDKNGKKIFEGDIIIGDDGFVEKCRGVVEYSSMAFCIRGEAIESKATWFYTITTQGIGQDNGLEVVGTIHDNDTTTNQ